MHIRKAKPQDAQALLDYLRTVGGESDNLTFGSEGLPISPEAEAEYLAALENAPKSVMLVAEDNGQIVGNIGLQGIPRQRLCHRADLAISVRKSHWGNALTATLQTEKRPLCLSLARQAGAAKNATLPSGMQQLNIVPGALPDWLVSTEDLKNVTRDPLAEARRVLVVGQGGEADNQEIAMLAEKLGAEVGYSRARVMNGGVDAEKVIGISGHLLAPEVCIVVGASGAAALMAGVRNSKFVVAINHDASAAVFSQADVGVVDDWKVVLEALVTNIHADCQ